MSDYVAAVKCRHCGKWNEVSVDVGVRHLTAKERELWNKSGTADYAHVSVVG